MNSITKIGKIALLKIYEKKPWSSGGKKYTTTVIFSTKPIDLTTKEDEYREPNVIGFIHCEAWSIALGQISVGCRDNQTLLRGMVKKLLSLKKPSAPSHYIIRKTIEISKTEYNFVVTIFRLTREQEDEIYYDYLTPAAQKKEKALNYERVEKVKRLQGEIKEIKEQM
ncbi:MAG TPA: hypothetical protein VL576_03335 [Candidatus Paceibacterota bacterium]|jgi:hypothetical protein|nr:hypothetical protein [Candidatus Paceibacterota bacterium]